MAKTYTKSPPQTRWHVDVDVAAEVVEEATLTPSAELEPFRLLGYDTPSYRIRRGWPVSPPEIDVHSSGSITSTGAVTVDRPLPHEITTGARARWIASDYDAGTYTWAPSQGNLTNGWTSDATYTPTLEPDVLYRRGKKLFSRDALAFDPDASNHMWSSFATEVGALANYSVVMVLSLDSFGGETDDDADEEETAGLWVPTLPDVGDPSLQVMEGSLRARSSSNRAFYDLQPLYRYQISNSPIYLAFVVGYPRVRYFVGRGPKSLRSRGLDYPWSAHNQNLDLYLGRTYPDINHTISMRLFDLCFYDTRLDRKHVHREVAKLARSYGGR